MLGALKAIPAFRELGGLPLAGGRRVKAGRVFRAGGLPEVSPAQRQALAALGIGTVIDLRSPVERQLNPSRWGEACGARVLECDVNGDVRAGGDELLRLLRDAPDSDGARRMMQLTYRHFGQAFAPHLAKIFDILINDHGPVLIHCTAGKDRTGFACVLILNALAADEDAIMDDYLASGRHAYPQAIYDATAKMLAAYLGALPPPEVVSAVMGIDAAYLGAALGGLRADYGSLSAYLEVAGGLDDARQQRLRAALSDPA